MRITLNYAGEPLHIDLPAHCTVDVFQPGVVGQAVTAVDFSTSISPYRERLDALGKLLIVVNDSYRHTPTETILTWLEESIPGVLDFAEFLIATGTHPSPDEAQLGKIFGQHLAGIRPRVTAHDCRDQESMVRVGQDCFGEEVFLNQAVLKADQVVVIGSVEPHYFAGYTGGRKSLFPGLTDFATIERNHNQAASLDCRPLQLAGNPVSEHLDELLAMVDTSHIISVQAVLDSKGQIAGLFTGNLSNSFTRAVNFARKLYAHRIDQPYDLVLTELLPPLDTNLYQVQKALENCQAAVADGGTVILFSVCDEGVGSRHFFDLADSWDRFNNRPHDGIPRFGSHKLSRVNAIGKRIQVCLYSSLPADTVRRVFYEPVVDVEHFVANLCEEKNKCRVAVVHDGGHTVLTYE